MNYFDLNLRQLQTFVTVARLGSFTRAARLLHLSQPALTREIGVIEKNGRSLSPAAESFLKTLKEVCRGVESVNARSRFDHAK